MYGNKLLLLISLFVVVYGGPEDRRKFVRVITEPKPGEEYVSIHTGKPSAGAVQEKSLDDHMSVQVRDEGQIGVKDVMESVPLDEKVYINKKVHPAYEEIPRKLVTERKSSLVRSDETQLNNKLKNNNREEQFKKTKIQENKEDDGLYDFVDSPFGGQLVGSASSQASRVNIKKAPNGQEYEYEYVYYYYDDDEKSGPKTESSTPNSLTKLEKETKERNKTKRPTVLDENKFVQSTNNDKFHKAEDHLLANEPEEGPTNFVVNDIPERQSKTKDSGRNLEEALSLQSPSVLEERLPSNPRFPIRSRGNSKPDQETVTQQIADSPITRVNSASQPGLDLVDSNTFRSHSNGEHFVATSPRREYQRGLTDKGAVDLYAILQQTRSEETANTILPIEQSTRFDENDTPFPTTIRLVPTTSTTTTTTTTTTQAPTTTTTTTLAPTRQSGLVRNRYRGAVGNRNSITSSTTTTTTTEQPSNVDDVTERRKFKPSRDRITQGQSIYSKRYQSSTAALEKDSTTTESEVVTKATKHSFGRQRTRSSKPQSSTVSIDETPIEVTSAASRPNFADRSNLRKQSNRNKFTASTTTSATVTQAIIEENVASSQLTESESSEPISTTSKAVGSRLRPSIRPLRPGLRLGSTGRGSSTTQLPSTTTGQLTSVAEISPENENKETVQESSSTTPTPDSLSRLKNKNRFRVPEKQSYQAPRQQTIAPVTGQNRKNLLSNLLPKKKSLQTEEPPTEEIKPVIENEQSDENNRDVQNEEELNSQQITAASTTSTTEAPTSTTNRLSSLLAKRKPLQRRPADLQQHKSTNQEE